VPITNTADYERNPQVSGDYVSYESYAVGDSDIWVYSISFGVSERVTLDSAEQYLHDISSNRVVYTDNRNYVSDEDYQLDIYMVEFQFISDIDVSPLSYDYGDVVVGTTSSQIVTITNSGIEACTFTVGLSSGSNQDFTITSDPSGLSVEPNGTVDVEITFSPTSVGILNAVLDVSSDIPNPTVEVQLIGTGVPSEDPPEQQVAELLDFINESVDDGTLYGIGNGNSGENRLNALINMIEAAGDLIAAGDITGACDQLMSAYKKCDGMPRPPDFVAGPASDELELMILGLMASLGCQ
jgi:hypothetical protein